MDSNNSHTPTPWQTIAVDGSDTKFIYADGAVPYDYRDSDGIRRTAHTRLVALVYGTYSEPNDLHAPAGAQEANAELIVRAVNCHAELLNLVKNILPLAIKTDAGGQWVADAREVIAKAEGRA